MQASASYHLRFLPALLLLLLASLALAGCGGKGRGVAGECDPASDYPAPAASPRLFADAGPDYEVATGDDVFLDGSASLHSDGRPLTFHWDQVAGPCVKLDFSNPQQPTFTAPRVPADGALLVFRLVVEADGQYSAPDEAEVQVAS